MFRLPVCLAGFAVFALWTSPVHSQPPVARTILFFGDSLTAGFGLDDPAKEGFPALIQQRLQAAGLAFHVVNAGVNGDTSADGLGRVGWVMREPIAILVLELGANDGLHVGLSPDKIEGNLQGIVDRVKARNPSVRVIIAGMQLPPNLGADYTEKFAAIFPDLLKANPGAVLIPFLLDKVGGVPGLNQPDHIHPTAAGERIVADNVWAVLEPVCRAFAK